MILATARLELALGTADRLRADLAGPATLARVLGAHVPENWPPDLYDRDAAEWSLRFAEEHPTDGRWNLYYLVDPSAESGRTCVGIVGFKGAPAEGRVEVGYSVLSQFRRRGYASEAVKALVELAFAHDGIDAVLAETLPELRPSIGVLERLGFRLTGAGSEPGVIRYQLDRSAWLASPGVASES